MTPAEIITAVRELCHDTDTDTALQRFEDDALLGFVNQTLKRMALMRPDIFAYVGAIPCTDGEVVHTAPADSIRIMEIFRIQGGNAVRETNREVLDQSVPSWPTATAAAAVNWMRHPRNNNRFFTYPPAVASQVLIGEYSRSPGAYAVGDTINDLPDAYFTAVVDGTMFLAQSVDDEHVLAQRAAMFQESFMNSLQANMESRVVTDLEQGGHDKKELP